jgi:hypothetical protein
MATKILSRFALIACLLLAACGGGDPADIEADNRETIDPPGSSCQQDGTCR